MQIDNLVFPIFTLGINRRLGLWLVGCPHACPGCSNPELWEKNDKKEVPLNKICALINDIHQKEHIEGVTISGGEPFAQSEELAKLVVYLQEIGIKDILLYTGYTFEELKSRDDHVINTILSNIALLIDGRYIETLNDNIALRGSSNQRLIFFDEDLKQAYEPYLREERKVQLVGGVDNVIAVGIPPKYYIAEVLKKGENNYADE